ncbi:hypothetical protein G7Y41_03465 [Schaalia sp. ZJ405]|uniref:ABC transporter permease n=1 Tax=Schaalia sp. ZJ405 TaxID=2709403 RepID=UPI0018CAF20E|nr:ABC transporter permease [Schaalia sp. ZJ405]QPK81892.1 hypothetical protein G7Y41_03465 [Schaalia sp. ZJ405]
MSTPNPHAGFGAVPQPDNGPQQFPPSPVGQSAPGMPVTRGPLSGPGMPPPMPQGPVPFQGQIPFHGQVPPAGPTYQQPKPQTPLSRQMKALVSPAGLLTLAFEILATLGVGLVSALLIVTGSFILNTGVLGFLGFPGQVINSEFSAPEATIMLIGGVLGGGFTSETQTFTIFLFGTFIGVIVTLRAVLRRRVWVDGTIIETMPTAVRALIEGVIVALVITLLTAFFSADDGAITSLTQLQTGAWHGGETRPLAVLTFIVITVLVACVSFVERRKAVQARLLPPFLTQALRELRRAHAILFGVFGLVTLAVFVFMSIVSFKNPGVLLLAPLFLPNMAVLMIGLAYFGEVTPNGIGIGYFQALTVPLEGFTIPSHPTRAWYFNDGWGFLLMIIGLVLILVMSASIGVQRERTSVPVWTRVWQTPLCALILWIVLGLGVTNSHNLTKDTGTFLHVGMSWWTPFTVALAFLAASVLAEVTPRYLAANAPGLLTLCAGRRATQAWLASPVRFVAPKTPAMNQPRAPHGMPQQPMVPMGQRGPVAAPPAPGNPMPGPGQAAPGQPAVGQPMPGQPVPGQPMIVQPRPGQPIPGPQWGSGPTGGQPGMMPMQGQSGIPKPQNQSGMMPTPQTPTGQASTVQASTQPVQAQVPQPDPQPEHTQAPHPMQPPAQRDGLTPPPPAAQ